MLRLLTLFCALSGPAHGASYDPDMTWRTITTEHFNIHFHQGQEALAEEFSFVVEDVYDTMTDEMQWTPRRRTEVVLVDRTDYANGYAGVVPYNQIVLFSTAPTGDSTLALYEDWATALFTHELTHVLHMDTNHGIVRAARSVVGRIASSNAISPWWMVEGLATFQETRQTQAGRGRASWPDMYKRTAVVEDAFPPLGNLDGLQPFPPAGNLRYIFGQDFIQYIADTHGEDTWTRWVHQYGSSLPYVFRLPSPDGWRKKPVWPAQRAFRDGFVSMYRDWHAHVHERYTQQAEAVRAEGETVGRLVSGGPASCVAPTFSPNGEHLVWSCLDLKTGNAIWMSDGAGYAREKLAQDKGAGHFTWRADSEAFVYAGVHLVNRFNTWSDIYMYGLSSGRTTALTSGARARDPAFSPDGSRLLYVTNRSQNNQLETMTVDQRRNRLTQHTDHTQYDSPVYSPDGRVLAASIWRDGRRDLWLLDTDGSPRRQLTADAALDTDPVWAADGSALYFVSDRTGIPNVYAIEIATERLYQVTNVVTGVAHPTAHPTEDRLAYQLYSQNGWDIVVLDHQRSHWRDRGLLPRPIHYGTAIADLTAPLPQAPDASVADTSGEWDAVGRDVAPAKPGLATQYTAVDPAGFQSPPSEGLDSFDDEEVEDVYGAELDYPFTITPHRYNPFPTLLPRFIAPYVQSTPRLAGPVQSQLAPWFPWGLQGTVSSASSDPLRHFAWSGWGSFRTDVERFGGGGVLTLNRFLPVYSLAASTAAVPRGVVPVLDPDNLFDPEGNLIVDRVSGGTYWERRNTASMQVGWPYRLRSSVFAGYTLSTRQSVFDLPEETYTPELPLRGTLGSVNLGYRFSWQQATPLSISREDGRTFSVVGAVLNPALGASVLEDDGTRSPLSQVQLTSEVREYTVMPWLPNHVVATRAGGGVTLGATDFLGNYLLGGSFGDSAFYVTPDEFRMLRGHPFGSDIGDMYWMANVEYRLPLWYVERGVGTLPAYGRNVSASVFFDSGNAFNSPTLTGGSASLAALLNEAGTRPLFGTGAELSGRVVLGWGLAFTGRLGYAVGFGPTGYKPRAGDQDGDGRPDALEGLYFQLGGSY